MLLASYRNTEASYRPKFRAPEEPQQRLESPSRWEHEARMRRIDALNAEVRAQVEANRLIALEKAQAILAEIRGENHRFQITIAEIMRRACKLFKVSKIELQSARRKQEIVFAKQFVAYWSSRLTSKSLPEIGRRMGGRDHTTILHSKRKYREKRAAMGRNLRPA